MKLSSRQRALGCWVLALALTGCATTVPYVGQGPHPQFERGRPVVLVDAVGNVLALPFKILLFDWRFASHSISEGTEQTLVEFVDGHQQQVGKTQISLNEYAPHKDLKRLFTNKNVAWPYRIFPGLFSTLLVDVLLPGRLFPWGDYYNPWTNTAHLYSDHPAIGLHELGHAYDVNKRRYKGSYAFARIVPFVDLYQEWKATDTAIDYLKATDNRQTELRAYTILYPAYGTYLGNYIPFFGSVIGLVVGHLWGRAKAFSRALFYRQLDAAVTTSQATQGPPQRTPPITQPQPAAP